MSLASILAAAYGVRLDQIVGPKWLTEEHFDITAALPGGATPDQVPLMLRRLLAERFQMTVREETKSRVFYALVPAKGGVKMAAADAPQIRPTVEMNSENIELKDYTMVRFAEFLTTNMRQPVVDETGLTGTFNIKLFVSMGDIRSARAMIAIRQLGLNLEKRSRATKQIVVEKADKTPAAN